MSNRDTREPYEAELKQRVKCLEYELRTLEARVASLENSFVFRILRWAGRPVAYIRAVTLRLFLKRWPRLYQHFHAVYLPRYPAWVESERELAVPELTSQPRFRILLPVFRTKPESLQETIASITAQSYLSWELCICCPSSSEEWLEKTLALMFSSDPRISVSRWTGDYSETQALQQAARGNTSDYVFTVYPGDRLAPQALHWMATEDGADLIYSDEDHLDQHSQRCEPVFKPGWSPDLLLSCMYLGSSIAVSRHAFERAGGFQAASEGAPHYDLALRITDGPVDVRHVSKVLYHRQKRNAGLEHDSAGMRYVANALKRRGEAADVEPGSRPGFCQVHWKPREVASVSLIVCSRSPRLLAKCLRAVERRTSYPAREVIVVQHLGNQDTALQAVIESAGAKRVAYSGAFHFSRMNNLGARIASGDALVFLNDDVEPLEGTWLERMVGQLSRPDIGIAGARLLYPSGAVQHAGVAVGIHDGCGHVGRGLIAAPPFWPWLELSRDVAAVTGACMAIRTSLFRQLCGFAEAFPVNYNDIDLCLRARKAGYRVVFDAGAVLRHYECQSRAGVVTWEERQRWYDQWHELIDSGDPFYSPYLSRRGEQLALGLPNSGGIDL